MKDDIKGGGRGRWAGLMGNLALEGWFRRALEQLGRQHQRSDKIGYVKRTGLTAICGLLAGLGGVSGVATPAWAQRSSIGIGLFDPSSSFRPEVSEADLRTLLRVLEVGPSEREAIGTLYEGYVGGLKARAAEISAVLNDAVERAEVMADARLVYDVKQDSWEAEAKKMQGQFLADMQGLLTPEQMGKWPLAEREMRRLKRASAGRLPGESIDLVRILDDVDEKAMDRKDVREVMEQYAQELDGLLRSRDKLIEDQGGAFQEKIKTDPKGAESLWNDAIRARRAIAEVNRKYAKQVTPLLSEAAGAVLSKRMFDATFPKLIEPTKSEKWARGAATLSSLTEEQKTQIRDLLSNYDTQRVRLLEKIAREQEAFELERRPLELVAALAGTEPRTGWDGKSDLPRDHPLMKLREERYALDSGVRKRIAAVLTEEQRSEVPSEFRGWASFVDDSPYGL
jgi:Spy/CpxP family protein refolding chaperone